ncbi:MATE family efflux transporter [Salinispirillum sp. LH 10-3-1]|uniref:MATE family efflux transporter n=1 Tax=Salinispirillum sp. LH 10-3-1 TaxID=2952525 RepID=A0AB38YFL1_9GAMM
MTEKKFSERLKKAHATHSRRVWQIAWPLMLANVSAPLLGLVDIGLMGHQGESRYLAAVTLGANLFAVIAWGFNFLTMAASGSTAWLMGRGGRVLAVRWLLRLLPPVAVLGLLLLFATPWLIPLGLAFYQPSSELASSAQTYLAIRAWSIPLVLVNLLLAGWFIGIQLTRVNLFATLCAQAVNILVSVFLVLGLNLGIAGVAAGSVIGDLAAFLIYSGTAFYLYRHNLSTVIHKDIPKLTHYLKLAAPLILRTFTLLFAFNYFSKLGLGLGTDYVAANAVLISFLLVISTLLDGFANAAEALVGRAAGASQRQRIQAAILATGLWSALFAVALCLIFALLHEPAIALLTDLSEIRQLAGQYVIWMITMPLYTWWAYWLDGVFIGLQWVRAMRNVLILSVFGIYWPLSLVVPMESNHSIWALFALMMLLRSLMMLGWLGLRWSRL